MPTANSLTLRWQPFIPNLFPTWLTGWLTSATEENGEKGGNERVFEMEGTTLDRPTDRPTEIVCERTATYWEESGEKEEEEEIWAASTECCSKKFDLNVVNVVEDGTGKLKAK